MIVVTRSCSKCNSNQCKKVKEVATKCGFKVIEITRQYHKQKMKHFINGKILNEQGEFIENFDSTMIGEKDFENYLNTFKNRKFEEKKNNTTQLPQQPKKTMK